MKLSSLQNEIRAAADPARALTLARFFKSGPGQYGEGDRFRGITVPVLRALAKRYAQSLSLDDCGRLLDSPWHEERLAALLVMVDQFRRGDEKTRQAVFERYLSSTGRINNWDLVDLSAPQIAGGWLMTHERDVLETLARSTSLWERRIAMIATMTFIRAGDFDDALTIAELLLKDTHDLIHKAAGWMLREIGKRDLAAERAFLDRHAAVMPRTMLRYAVERFPAGLRTHYMKR